MKIQKIFLNKTNISYLLKNEQRISSPLLLYILNNSKTCCRQTIWRDIFLKFSFSWSRKFKFERMLFVQQWLRSQNPKRHKKNHIDLSINENSFQILFKILINFYLLYPKFILSYSEIFLKVPTIKFFQNFTKFFRFFKFYFYFEIVLSPYFFKFSQLKKKEIL